MALNLQYHIMSNPSALLVRGQKPTSYLARTFCSSNPRQHLLCQIYSLAKAVAVCLVRGVRVFFVFFFVSPREGQKLLFFFFRKDPGHTECSKRAKASSYACKIITPQGAFTRVITVAIDCQYVHSEGNRLQ